MRHSMRVLSATDTIFRKTAAEYEPWFPEPTPHHAYPDEESWQRAHLWDSMGETGGNHGPFRGPTILHHPDLPYALEHGWRVNGGDRNLDFQSRGEVGSGNPYLYKIGPDGVIHQAHLSMGPEDASMALSDADERGDGSAHDMWGEIPEKNWRHLIHSEGGTLEGPEAHSSLINLVDDEQARSMDPTHNGYKDFVGHRSPLYGSQQDEDQWRRNYQNTIRRAWETGTNTPHMHWNDPVPDPYADIDKLRPSDIKQYRAPDTDDGGAPGASKHPRYGSEGA